jgi:hypothetical protein
MWAYGKYSAGELTAADGKTEIYRQLTTRLHNDIHMPGGTRGKQFVARAAFLKHVNDAPRFGNEPMFSMPLTTEDFIATFDHRHHELQEEQPREIERLRREIEHLRAELHNRQ